MMRKMKRFRLMKLNSSIKKEKKTFWLEISKKKIVLLVLVIKIIII